MPIERVTLARINLEDESFRITTEKDLKELAASIRAIGLIHSPVLKKKRNGYCIVSGFRRILSIFNIGWTEVESRILPENETDAECAGVAIAANAMERPLNTIEQANAYALLNRVYPDDTDLASIGKPLGLKGNPAFIAKLLSVTALPDQIQAAVAEDVIPLPIAERLCELPEKTACGYADIFSLLKPGLNVQREIMTLFREIAAREGTNVLDIIESPEVRGIVFNDHADRGKKIKELRLWLKRKRFPALTAAETQRNEMIRSLKLATGIQLFPPPYFEGTSYSIEMKFSQLSELQKHSNHLEKLIEQPILKKILSKSTQ